MTIKVDLCNNRKCMKKTTCYKYTNIPAKGWQKKVNFDYEKGLLCYKEDYELTQR